MRITGLAKAPQHNGKVGKVSSKAAQEQGRVGVELGKGQTLSVRLQNLERAEEPEPSAVDAPMPAAPEGVQRTLQRDNAVLQEFDGSGDPNTLVLYHHLRDRAFDAFNAAEYNEQMLRYYAGGITVSEVVPRKMGDNDYLLVCLRNKVEDYNTLCELSFQCMRQFCGISLLLKCRCFTCHRPNAPRCACQCACFCSDECRAADRSGHAKLCKLICASTVNVDTESVQL